MNFIGRGDLKMGTLELELLKTEGLVRHLIDDARSSAEPLAKRWLSLNASSDYWQGAGVALLTVRPPRPEKPSFYGEPEYVVSPHAAMISGAFDAIKGCGGDVVDFSNKHELYGEMAKAANYRIHENPAVSGQELTVCVLEAARNVFADWREEEARFESIHSVSTRVYH
jgi:hypothetical protein